MTAPDHGDGWAGRVDLLETALRRANQRAQAYSDGLRLADAQLWHQVRQDLDEDGLRTINAAQRPAAPPTRPPLPGTWADKNRTELGWGTPAATERPRP